MKYTRRKKKTKERKKIWNYNYRKLLVKQKIAIYSDPTSNSTYSALQLTGPKAESHALAGVLLHPSIGVNFLYNSGSHGEPSKVRQINEQRRATPTGSFSTSTKKRSTLTVSSLANYKKRATLPASFPLMRSDRITVHQRNPQSLCVLYFLCLKYYPFSYKS